MSDTLELVEAPQKAPAVPPEQAAADEYQREAIATAQSDEAHAAALREFNK